MDSTELSHDDLLQVRAFATQFMRDLAALRDRMSARGFPDDDPLVKCVADALDAGRSFYLAMDRLTERAARPAA